MNKWSLSPHHVTVTLLLALKIQRQYGDEGDVDYLIMSMVDKDVRHWVLVTYSWYDEELVLATFEDNWTATSIKKKNTVSHLASTVKKHSHVSTAGSREVVPHRIIHHGEIWKQSNCLNNRGIAKMMGFPYYEKFLSSLKKVVGLMCSSMEGSPR